MLDTLNPREAQYQSFSRVHSVPVELLQEASMPRHVYSVHRHKHTVKTTVKGSVFDERVLGKIRPFGFHIRAGRIGGGKAVAELVNKGKRRMVNLENECIQWYDEDGSMHTIALHDVLSVTVAASTLAHPASSPPSTPPEESKVLLVPQVSQCPQTGLLAQAVQVMFSVQAVTKGDDCVWRLEEFHFECTDAATSQLWIAAFRQALQCEHRPKKLLVLINPYGGWKKAPTVYQDVAAPIFQAAKITTDVIATKHADHAREIIEGYTGLDSLDGVVAVGGDGFFNDVLNCVLARTDRPAHLRLGLIPAGSTNCVIYSATGTDDATTAALHIALGSRTPLDVAMVTGGQGVPRLAASLVTYGFYGDVVTNSERYRWMGPLRYNWSGFRAFMKKSTYGGTLYVKRADKGRGEGGLCLKECPTCPADLPTANAPAEAPHTLSLTKPAEFKAEDGWEVIEGDFMCINAAVISCRCEKSPNGMAPHAHLSDGCLDLILVRNCRHDQYLFHLTCLADRAADHLAFDFIDVIKAREFWFEPRENSPKSRWVADGEPLDDGGRVGVQVQSNLVHIFASRPSHPPKVIPRLESGAGGQE